MCKQTIIQHTCPAASHRGYSLITPCISRALHPKGFKRYIHKSTSPCPLPGCEGPKSTGAYNPKDHPEVLVNGNTITGFVVYSSDTAVVSSWEAGAFPLAEKEYTPPIPLGAIPSHMLQPIVEALQTRCRTGEGRGFQRTRQDRYWSHGLRWRVGDHAEGDVWGGGEEMPKGLPCAWSEGEGFVFGRGPPVVPRELEEVVGRMVGGMGGEVEF